MALSTWLGAELLEVHTDPLDTATSSLIATISACESRPGKAKLST